MVHVATDGAHLHDGPALPDVSARGLILCDTTGAIVGVRGRPSRSTSGGDGTSSRWPCDAPSNCGIGAAGSRAVPAVASRFITSCTGKTADRPTPTTWSACAPNTTACTTEANGITGNPTRPDGLVLHRPLRPPPTCPPPPTINGDGAVPMPDVTGTWTHPLGERLHTRWLTFTPDPPARPLLC